MTRSEWVFRNIPRRAHAVIAAAETPVRRPVAFTSMTSEDYVLADPDEAIRAGVTEAPYWAVIHPSAAVNLIHGKPTGMDIARAVEGHPIAIGAADSGWVALVAEDAHHDMSRPINDPAAGFLGLPPAMVRGPVVLVGGPDPDGDVLPLPADVRMRLVREVIEA